MAGKLKPWHIVVLLALVAIAWGVGLWAYYLQIEKEHIETVHVWTPDHAVTIKSLLGGSLQFGSGSQGLVFLWKDTHTPEEYQQLDTVVNFFDVEENQIRYLGIVRKSDGTVSVARATIPLKIPDPGFLLEKRDVIFDPATGMVTAQYTRPLMKLMTFSVIIPLIVWAIVSILVAMARGFKLDKPMFSPKRVPA